MEVELRNMVNAFRVTELQTLLCYAGKNKNGRKGELQSRALDLVKNKSTANSIALKIRELYRSIQRLEWLNCFKDVLDRQKRDFIFARPNGKDRICLNHFESKYKVWTGRTGYARVGLIGTAIPTLNLGEDRSSNATGASITSAPALRSSARLSTLSQLPPASANVPNPGYRSEHPYSHGTTTTSNTATLGAMQNARLFTQSQYNSGASGGDKTMSQNRNPFSPFGMNKMPGLQALGLGLGQGLPICPDVRMKRLPFYDIMTELHKPTSLISQGGRVLEASFPFCLTPSQAGDIASSKEYTVSPCGEAKIQYTTQVQLRFCSIETLIDQDDLFPPSMVVRMNGKVVPLPHPIPSNRPGVEPKRPSRPLNVTNYVKLSPTVTNQLSVAWASDISGKQYAMSLYLVKKLCAQTLLNRLKGKGPRQADFTRGMIKDICKGDDSDCCVATTSLKVSLACPLGKCRMTLPCRATTCAHLQCFDANLFLQMNEKKPTWLCPVCDKPLLFESLAIDGYFDEIIKNVPYSSGNDVEILPNGKWSVATTVKNEPSDSAPLSKKMKPSESSKMNQTIDLDDDLIIEDEIMESPRMTSHPSDPPKKPGPADIVDLTLSSSEDEDEEDEEDEVEAEMAADPAPQAAKDDKSVSSDEEEIGIGRTRRRRIGKPNYVVDDSSSDSSTSTRGPDSPASITLLESPPRPPSFEPRNADPARSSRPSSGTTSASVSNGTNYTSRSGSTYGPYTQQPSMPNLGSLSYGGMSGVAPPLTRSQSNAMELVNHSLSHPPQGTLNSMMFPNSTSSTPTYLPFDARSSWDTSYQMPTDFTALDFPSMDYFNQTSFNSNQNNPPGGSGSASGGGSSYGGSPRW